MNMLWEVVRWAGACTLPLPQVSALQLPGRRMSVNKTEFA